MTDIEVTSNPISKEKLSNKDSEFNYEKLEVLPAQAYGIMNRKINNNMEFIDKNTVVFISGCNIVCYDIFKKKSHFLIRKCPEYLITSLSVGYKSYVSDNSNDPYICVGEFNPITKKSHISAISVKNSYQQYNLNFNNEKTAHTTLETKNHTQINSSSSTTSNPFVRKMSFNFLKENSKFDWKISSAKILTNSSYCICISTKREDNSYPSSNLAVTSRKKSKISVFKFTQEKLISDCVIDEDITSFNYNPRNPLELIFCGKGYLRLWNVFINDGSLKEHPQRFFLGKQEKEHNFIKAEFFENNSFMFIVGTRENIFYIIEGFTIIYELNACYSKESIYDLKIDNLLSLREANKYEEEEEHENNIKGDYSKNHTTNENEALRTDNSGDSFLNKKILHYMTDKNTDDNNLKFNNDKNPLKTFNLIQNSIILICFENESVTKIFVLEKDFKNQKKKKIPVLSQDEEGKDPKNKKEESKVIRFAKNINTVLGMISNPDKTLFMFILELYPNQKKINKSNKSANSKLKDNTFLSIYLFQRSGKDLTFVGEVFKEFFSSESIKNFDINEKKKILFSLTHDNWLRCFDFNSYQFMLKYQMKNNPTSITASPHNNLLGVCYEREFAIYAIFKKKVGIFCEFEIIKPFAKFSEKGDLIAVSGQSRVNRNFCIYFVDTLYFNTIYVIENLPIIQNLKFLNNDQFLFVLTENFSILGWRINLSFLTVNLSNRLKDNGKKISQFFFEPFWIHSIKGNEYEFYDYHSLDDVMLSTLKNNQKRIVIISDKGNHLNNFFDLDKAVTSLKIVKELNSVFIGTEVGSLKILKWPVIKKVDEKEIVSFSLLYEINLHANSLNNLLFTKNYRNIITSSTDGSTVISNIFLKSNKECSQFDNCNIFSGSLNKPSIEESIKICEVYEHKISDITYKDKKVIELIKEIEIKQKSRTDQIANIVKDHKIDVINLQAQKRDALTEEGEKETNLLDEIKSLENSVETEMQKKFQEHEKEKERIRVKYLEKIELYNLEIKRLEDDLKKLQCDIRIKFDNIQYEQLDFFNKIFDEYDQKYSKVKEQIDQNLKILLKVSTENDAATDLIQSQYEEMKREIDEKLINLRKENEISLTCLKEECDSEKKKENDFKTILQQKISETDKLIAQNSEIKKRLIETTQKTITFQEQLLETEKNLTKIDNKIEEMDGKNKHLEQIRFVLEHRMTSLEKEKTPLENQCINLEKQKNRLQDEFNKLILEINLRNQKLEIKQSELKACLIQNFEVNDHIQYVKKKLEYLKSELNNFIKTYETEDGNGKILSLQQNKITIIAAKLRQFYESCFSININEQLKNFNLYSSKLQEESEKINMTNNLDLIMRDKGEEKLIAEEKKMAEIQNMKGSVFKRMQKENTILISECNRLRKNLHEIYMHVVDIEEKFCELTKINPNLKKEEIVNQIQNFIQETHTKIKSNFKEEMIEEFASPRPTNPNNILEEDANNKNIIVINHNKDIINTLNQNTKSISQQKINLGNIKVNLLEYLNF